MCAKCGNKYHIPVKAVLRTTIKAPYGKAKSPRKVIKRLERNIAR